MVTVSDIQGRVSASDLVGSIVSQCELEVIISWLIALEFHHLSGIVHCQVAVVSFGTWSTNLYWVQIPIIGTEVYVMASQRTYRGAGEEKW